MPATAQTPVPDPAFSWRSFMDLLSGRGEPQDPGPGGTGGPRPGNGLCLATFARTSQTWNTRPLLIWQGGQAVGLKLKGNPTFLWQGQSGKAWNQTPYRALPLRPGQSYEWVFFFDQAFQRPMYRVTFQVMAEPDRAAISADLFTLSQQLKAQQATEETIALQRARYFAQRRLWADVLQEIYSVPNPSAQLKEIAQTIPAGMCSKTPVIRPGDAQTPLMTATAVGVSMWLTLPRSGNTLVP